MSNDDDLPAQLAEMAERIEQAQPRTPAEHRSIASVSAQFARVLEVLVARGVLSKNDVRLMAHVGESASRPKVKLAVVRNKHAVKSLPIDCASFLTLCQGRCCTFSLAISPADIAEGKLVWDFDDPYMLARGDDGYCKHLQVGGGCECYGDRPSTCREYDCRQDPRVWLDFENRIPAPMPDGVKPRF